ncbi:16S rRNA (uracil(1498)-N(3))-methyltransferase [Methylomonas sp. AM2-LC]|uniref:16S rRNA (uracil(1498)-N(3))-methyltransferase n=1 Tax=Methylomonas sp. AM2-LC TaxID=3153301 RepID=UPI003266E089
MRVSRVYIDTALNVGQDLALNEEASHYLRSVLRLKAEQSIILFNGTGGEFAGKLTEVSRKSVRVKIEKLLDRDVESPLSVHIGMGISRGDRMDWSIQKAVELGVNQLTPLITERCVIKFNDDKKLQRWQHWLHIIQHATEQSGRTRIPELGQICPMATWAHQQQGLKVFLDPFAEQTLTQLPEKTQQITLLSGPEGGFSDHERKLALAAGFIPVRLGARILRTETAILTALAAVQTLWGDFN